MVMREERLSLKTLHIVFIIASTLITFGMGVWGVVQYSAEGRMDYLLMGILCLISGVALLVYGIRFLQKLKHISYL